MQWVRPDELHLLTPLLIAALAGTLIGVEREFRRKSTGVGTNMLIATGACLFTLISGHVDGESTTRIASNIVQGIGFLGAGVIFRDTSNAVRGLTSAAGIWLTAAVGMAFGYEYYLLGGLGTVVAILSPRLPWWLLPKQHRLTVERSEKED